MKGMSGDVDRCVVPTDELTIKPNVGAVAKGHLENLLELIHTEKQKQRTAFLPSLLFRVEDD
jgi:hypothetical protein